ELTLHGQRHQQLLPHQAQTTLLHRLGVMKKFHFDGKTLPDPPAPPAGLAKDIDGISGLVEQNRGKFDQVEACLHQLWMANHRLYAAAELTVVPALSRFWWNLCCEHRNADA